MWQMAESSTEPTVVFAQLNVNDSWDAVASFGITTFPQLVLFRGWSDWRVYKGVFGPTRLVLCVVLGNWARDGNA